VIKYIPFEVEHRLVNAVDIDNKIATSGPIQTYLQTLASGLSSGMDLPDGMNIKVSLIDSDVVNAFATLDGNVVFFTGLLDVIPNENTLAMVMAHEIAHIKLRHPLRALGRGVVVGIAIATITGVASNDIVSGFIGNTGLLTALSFNRDQESAADKLAVEALVKHYGHAGGAAKLFEVFDKLSDKSKNMVPEFFATHPLNQNRTESIKKQAQEYQWALDGKLEKLPEPIISELKRLREESDETEKKRKYLAVSLLTITPYFCHGTIIAQKSNNKSN
jgi:predicted Zn-dependent protease